MKKFFPEICPECGTRLVIEVGKTEGIIKLKCSNPDCCGTFLKKLQKGIISLDIPGIKEATVQKLSDAGIKSVFDIFNPDIVNTEILVDSGIFKEGRALEKILNSINGIKEITIDKIILSLQFKDIGKTISREAGKMLSGVNYEFKGLNREACAKLLDPDSYERKRIQEYIEMLEQNDIKVIYVEKQKKQNIEIKKINKKVTFDCDLSTIGYTKEDLLEQLGWKEVEISETDLLIVDNKEQNSDKMSEAKSNAIKVVTTKQLKLLFL